MQEWERVEVQRLFGASLLPEVASCFLICLNGQTLFDCVDGSVRDISCPPPPSPHLQLTANKISSSHVSASF